MNMMRLQNNSWGGGVTYCNAISYRSFCFSLAGGSTFDKIGTIASSSFSAYSAFFAAVCFLAKPIRFVSSAFACRIVNLLIFITVAGVCVSSVPSDTWGENLIDNAGNPTYYKTQTNRKLFTKDVFHRERTMSNDLRYERNPEVKSHKMFAPSIPLQAPESTKLTDHQINYSIGLLSDNSILFVSDSDGQFGLWKMNADGNGKIKLANDCCFVNVVISPNRQKIAYSSVDSSNIYHIYVIDINGANKKEIDNDSDEIDIWRSRWSPDSQWFLYDKRMNGNYNLWLANADGSPANKVIDGIYCNDTSWSSDSNWIVYAKSNNIYKISPNGGGPVLICNGYRPTCLPNDSWIIYTNNKNICKISLSGGEPVPIATITGYLDNTAWSPDGKWILYIENEHDSSPESHYSLHKISPNGGEPVLIATSTEIDNNNMVWSPCSEWFLYRTNGECWVVKQDGTVKNKLFSGDVAGSFFFLSDSSKIVYSNIKDIYAIPLTGENPAKLTNNPYDAAMNSCLKWSPDGSKLLYGTFPNKEATGKDWECKTCVMNKDGGGKIELVSEVTDSDRIVWSPDSNWIAYCDDWSIYKISSNGGEPVRIATTSTRISGGIAWSPDGKWITYNCSAGGGKCFPLQNKLEWRGTSTHCHHNRICGRHSLFA